VIKYQCTPPPPPSPLPPSPPPPPRGKVQYCQGTAVNIALTLFIPTHITLNTFNPETCYAGTL
jgi:hypothetical protein